MWQLMQIKLSIDPKRIFYSIEGGEDRKKIVLQNISSVYRR